MKTQISYHDLPPSDTDAAREDIERVAGRLDRKTKAIGDDLKFLRVSVEVNEKVKAYGVTLSFKIPSHTLAAKAEKATFAEALRAAEKKLEQEVEHHFGKLRKDIHPRKGRHGAPAVEEENVEPWDVK